MSRAPTIASNKLTRCTPDLREWLKTKVPYAHSEELYQNPEEYLDFIGDEIENNAWLAMDIAKAVHAGGNPLNFVVETAAGTGVCVLRINEVNPNARLGCIEWSDKLCAKGKEARPDIEFFQEDMTSWTPPDGSKIDLMFNSAASLGFFDITQLDLHMEAVSKSLSKNGAYFIDQGYYSHISATSLDTIHYGAWTAKGRKIKRFTVVHGYNTLTDMHNISFSKWDVTDEKAKLMVAYTHQLRAYRYSELAYLAEKHGLSIRLWEAVWNDKAQEYQFQAVSEANGNVFVQKWSDDLTYMIEFYKGNAPLLVKE